MARNLPSWRMRIRRFARDGGGIASVEFALTLPILIALYFGGYEASDAVATYRKLADTTTTIANVAAQYTTMSPADVQSVFTASAQVMAPYPTTNLSIAMSEITTDNNGNSTVTWTRTYQGATGPVVGSTVTLPTGMAVNGTSYLLITTAYQYVLPLGVAFASNLNLSNQIYMVPRNSTSIPLT